VKLSDLLHEYGANAFVMVGAGNGSAYGEAGALVEVDEAALAAYGDIDLSPIDRSSSPWVDRDDVNFESDWIVAGQGQNPYRYKILF